MRKVLLALSTACAAVVIVAACQSYPIWGYEKRAVLLTWTTHTEEPEISYHLEFRKRWNFLPGQERLLHDLSVAEFTDMLAADLLGQPEHHDSLPEARWELP